MDQIALIGLFSIIGLGMVTVVFLQLMDLVKQSAARADMNLEALQVLKDLSESAFAHLLAKSGQDAAGATALRKESDFRIESLRQAINTPPPEPKTVEEQDMATARPGTIMTKQADGSVRILEPIMPGDEI